MHETEDDAEGDGGGKNSAHRGPHNIRGWVQARGNVASHKIAWKESTEVCACRVAQANEGEESAWIESAADPAIGLRMQLNVSFAIRGLTETI